MGAHQPSNGSAPLQQPRKGSCTWQGSWGDVTLPSWTPQGEGRCWHTVQCTQCAAVHPEQHPVHRPVQPAHRAHLAPCSAPSTLQCSTAAVPWGAESGCGREQGWRSWAFGEGRAGAGNKACGVARFWAVGVQSVCGAAVQECITLLCSCSCRGCAHGGWPGPWASQTAGGCCSPREARSCLWGAARSRSRCSRCSWA